VFVKTEDSRKKFKGALGNLMAEGFMSGETMSEAMSKSAKEVVRAALDGSGDVKF
jgi:hypothetical protein